MDNRWKLKAIDNFKDNKIKIDENQKTVKIQKQIISTAPLATVLAKSNQPKTDIYSIINVQKIDRAHSYHVKFDDKSTKWIPGKDIDRNI